MPGLETKISLSLGSKKAGATQLKGLKRARTALDDDDQDDGFRHGQIQAVSHFDVAAGGAIDDSRPRADTGPMVIAAQTDRDWKKAAANNRKRQKSGRPQEESQTEREQRAREIEAIDAAKKPSFGLSVHNQAEDGSKEQDGGDIQHKDTKNNGEATTGHEASAKLKTDDERAIDALLGKKESSTLVLPAMDEEQVYQRDVQSAPDMASLDDYARVPVEQFGAALLRGMGWKDGEGIGNQKGQKVQKAAALKRRPALLGIGAKEDAAVAQELGTWGKAAKKGGEVKIYNPVLLRDKKTGEVFTEEELEKKRAKAERDRYEFEFEERQRKDRRRDERDRSRERSSKRRHDSGDRRDGSDSRYKDRRDRGSSRDRHRSRRDDEDRRRRRERSGERREHRRAEDSRHRERQHDDRRR